MTSDSRKEIDQVDEAAERGELEKALDRLDKAIQDAEVIEVDI